MNEKDKSTSIAEKNIDTARRISPFYYSQPPVIERVKIVLARLREGDKGETQFTIFRTTIFTYHLSLSIGEIFFLS